MTRYWVSWWAFSQHIADGIPWPVWLTGQRWVAPTESCCAVIDAADESDVWQQVEEFYPSHERRFIMAKPDDWVPTKNRFP